MPETQTRQHETPTWSDLFILTALVASGMALAPPLPMGFGLVAGGVVGWMVGILVLVYRGRRV